MNKLDSMTSDFVGSLNVARTEAVRRNVSVSMCKSSNGTSCGGNWEDGWIVFDDNGAAPGTVDAGEEVLVVSDGFNRARYTLRGEGNVVSRITFDAQGYSLGFGGQLVLCFDEDGDGSGDFDDDNAAVIAISNSGRIRTLESSHVDVVLGDCIP